MPDQKQNPLTREELLVIIEKAARQTSIGYKPTPTNPRTRKADC